MLYNRVMALPVTSNNGSQSASSQNLQAPTGAGVAPAQTSKVQPTQSAALLRGGNGLQLNAATPVTTVPLAASGQSSTAQPAPQKHFNYGLTGLSIVLFIIAVLLFWSTSRSAVKSTPKF